MTAQPGIVTSSGPPNAVVQIQPGMQVQPVVLVDQNGQYVSSSGIPQGAGGLVWFATDNGLACDDTTDDTAALNTLLATVAAAGGGTVFFPSLARINGQVVLPTTLAAGQLRQAPIRLAGTMPNRPGESESGVTYPTGGLDLRYAGRTDTGCGTTAGSNIVTDASAVSGDYGQIITSPGNLPDRTYIMAVTPGTGYSLNNGARATNASASFTIGGGKIQAAGIGTLELDHMLLCDKGTSSQPFVLATGTTVNMHDCAVLGNASKSSGTCDQDVLVGGGPGQGTVLTSPLTSGTPVTSITVAALPVALNSGSGGVVITNGTNTQIITASAAALGATSITASFTPNANYGAGSAVLFGGQQSAQGATAYSVPAANFQGYGTRLHDNFFNRTRRVLLQNWASDVYIDTCVWWQNCGSNLAFTPATLTTAVNVAGSPYTTLAVTALPAAVATGDQIQLGTNSPGNAGVVTSQVATASAPAAAGATSVSISSFTATGTYAIGTKVINTTAGIGAALEVYSALGNVSQVNASTNRFEMSGAYSYAVRVSGTSSLWSTITGNNLQDSGAANIAGYRFDTGAAFNTLILGMIAASVPSVDDQSSAAGSQLVLRPQQSQPSLFPWGILAQGLASKMTDGVEPLLVDPAGGVYLAEGSAGSWFWYYTPAGGSQTSLLRLVYGSSTSATWTTASGITTLTIGGVAVALNIRSTSGGSINLGDSTRAADVSVLNGNLSVVHLLSQAGSGGAAPAVAAASSSTSLSIAGTDTAHNVALTTAASISAGASVATVTFNLSYATRAPSKTPRISITPKTSDSVAAQPYITGDGQAGYSIALQNPPAGATAMAFDVIVIAS